MYQAAGMHNAVIAADRTRQTATRQVPALFLVPAKTNGRFVTGMEHRGNRDVNGQESCEFARQAWAFFIVQGIYQAFRERHRVRVALLEVAVYKIFMARGRY
jgi:hypothetical protein